MKPSYDQRRRENPTGAGRKIDPWKPIFEVHAANRGIGETDVERAVESSEGR